MASPLPNKTPDEIAEYLAGIQKTIRDSEELMRQADLRIQETDRFLAEQGLTREEVPHLLDDVQLTPEQRKELDAQMDRWEMEWNQERLEAEAKRNDLRRAQGNDPDQDEINKRQRKFRNLMNPYRL